MLHSPKMQEGNRILIQFIIADLCPSNGKHVRRSSLPQQPHLFTDFDNGSVCKLIFDINSHNFKLYDNILGRFAFQHCKSKVKVTAA